MDLFTRVRKEGKSFSCARGIQGVRSPVTPGTCSWLVHIAMPARTVCAGTRPDVPPPTAGKCLAAKKAETRRLLVRAPSKRAERRSSRAAVVTRPAALVPERHVYALRAAPCLCELLSSGGRLFEPLLQGGGKTSFVASEAGSAFPSLET